MISQAAEYALRAVVCLARQPAAPYTTHQIAAETRVPPGYLAKVLQALARRGIVISQRGLNGGFLLARPPETMNLMEVVAAVDVSRRITSCPLGIVSHNANLCSLHRRLNAATEQMEQVLRDTTVAELLNDSTCSQPLCDPSCEKAVHHA